MDAVFSLLDRVVASVRGWLDLDFYEAALVMIAVAFSLVVYRLHRTDSSAFRFEDLFTHGDHDGKASVFRLLVFGSWMVHSWVIVRQEAYGHLATESLAMYAAIWSGSYVVLRGLQLKGGADGHGQAGGAGPGQGGAGAGPADGRAG